MKFNCGDSFEVKNAKEYAARLKEKTQEVEKWNKGFSYFALWPVRVGENDCRWFERVYVRNIHATLGTDGWESAFGLYVKHHIQIGLFKVKNTDQVRGEGNTEWYPNLEEYEQMAENYKKELENPPPPNN